MIHYLPAVLPPWGMTEAWEEANRSLDHHIRRHRFELVQAKVFAREIQGRLESIFSVLDNLCAATCPWCPDPCCLSAKVWVDFQDLLFLHLREQEIPPAQLLADSKKTCRYASLKGCTLTRITRPWVCTWYLCPTQTAILRNRLRSTKNELYKTIQAVKSGRKKMETAFIRAVS